MAASNYADLLQRGRTHMWAGRPIEAVLMFRRAVHLSERDVDARFHLGEMLWQLGLTDEAIASWREAAKIDPQFLAARLALAEALLARGDFADSRVVAAEALAMAPSDLRWHTRSSTRQSMHCARVSRGCWRGRR